MDKKYQKKNTKRFKYQPPKPLTLWENLDEESRKNLQRARSKAELNYARNKE
jgi:hypothetical protein